MVRNYGSTEDLRTHAKAEAPAEAPDPHRTAGTVHLWALGVGAVVSGFFFGWQTLLKGGWGAAVTIWGLATVLYGSLAFSVAELAAALPQAGGPYLFALESMGPLAAFVTGLAETVKVLLTCAAVAVGIGSYWGLRVGGVNGSPLVWTVLYATFWALNVFGMQASFRFQVRPCTQRPAAQFLREMA